MTSRHKFNSAAAEPFSADDAVMGVLSLLDAAEKTGASFTTKRKNLRAALLATNGLIEALEKGVAPQQKERMGKMLYDVAALDAGIEKDLNDYERPDTRFIQHAKAQMNRNIVDARDYAGKIGRHDEATALLGFQRFEDWVNAGQLARSIALAEIRIAQVIYGTTGNKPVVPRSTRNPLPQITD